VSRENVEIAKRAVDAYNRRDVAAIDDLFIPEFEVTFTLVEGAADFRGREGLETYFAEVRDTLPDVVLVAGQFRDLGERVLWLGRIEARGEGQWCAGRCPTSGHLRFSRRQDLAHPHVF
jgi:hypothetical protein